MLPEIFRVTAHTQHVGLGTTFVAIPGTRYHGNDFVRRAIAHGASRVVLEQDSHNCELVAQRAEQAGIPVDYVTSAREALARYSAHAYGYPHNNLTLIGITGTKGKTTTAMLTAQLLAWSDIRTAVVSSAGKYINGNHITYPLTTPQPDFLYAFLHQCRLHGVTHVVMEVAAQAISLHRVDGLVFDSVVVTNLSHEHGEFYSDHAAYRAAKEQLLSYTHAYSRILLNADDTEVGSFRAPCGHVTRFGFTKSFDIQVQHVSLAHEPVRLCCANWPTEVVSALYGEGNAYNVLAATLCAQRYVASWRMICHAHRHALTIPGRMEEFRLYHGATACLDYAHNEASYRMVLATLRQRFSHVWVVFGAAGGRDAAKRALMARAACAYADMLVITRDNPRSEAVEDIIADLYTGVDAEMPVRTIYNRAEAITWACSHVPADGVVAVLGKGRDRGEAIGNQVYPHSDYATILTCTQ